VGNAQQNLHTQYVKSDQMDVNPYVFSIDMPRSNLCFLFKKRHTFSDSWITRLQINLIARYIHSYCEHILLWAVTSTYQNVFLWPPLSLPCHLEYMETFFLLIIKLAKQFFSSFIPICSLQLGEYEQNPNSEIWN
jgi:hypothetical protein